MPSEDGFRRGFPRAKTTSAFLFATEEGFLKLAVCFSRKIVARMRIGRRNLLRMRQCRLGFIQGMSRCDDPYNDAMKGSFNKTLKRECIRSEESMSFAEA